MTVSYSTHCRSLVTPFPQNIPLKRNKDSSQGDVDRLGERGCRKKLSVEEPVPTCGAPCVVGPLIHTRLWLELPDSTEAEGCRQCLLSAYLPLICSTYLLALLSHVLPCPNHVEPVILSALPLKHSMAFMFSLGLKFGACGPQPSWAEFPLWVHQSSQECCRI